MNILNKKTIYAIIILLAILLIVGGVWYFFSGDTENGNEENPFGITNPFGNPEGGGDFFGDDQPEETSDQDQERAALHQITNAPVAGAGAFIATSTPNGTSTPIIRYMDRSSGNIFEMSLDTFAVRRITNTTIPQVHEALFAAGSRVVARYLDSDKQTIKTFVGSIQEPETESEVGTITGNFLPEGISDLALSRDKTELIYLSPASGNGDVVQTPLADLSASEVVFSSPFSEWLLDWQDNIFLTTKPSGVVAGYSYEIDGGLRKVAEGLGLTVNPSPDGGFVLYNNEQEGALSLFVRSRDSDGTRGVLFHTLPEKCVWAYDETRFYCGVPKEIPTATYPDAWYQGIVQFTDSLEVFSTETNVSSSLSSLDQAGQPLDITSPFLGPNGEYLFFTNKRDGTLWSYHLPQQAGGSGE